MSRSGPQRVPERADVEVSRLARPVSQAASARAGSESLAALAARANDAHKRVQRQTGEGLAHAIEAGAALLEVKQRVVGRQWLPWLSKNVDFSVRTAQLYMKMARESASGELEHVVDLSLRAAARAIAKPSTPARKTAAATGTAPNPPSTPAPAQASPPTPAPAQDSPPAIAAARSLPSIAATQTGGPTPVRRAEGDRKLDMDKLSRVRSVMSAIDPLLARAQNDELSAHAAAGLLREAARGARAVSDRLVALAEELEG